MANSGLRFFASLAPTAKDKLEVVRRVFPDADYDKSGEIVYTDPSTKKKVSLNPSGFDMGDIADYGDAAISTAGSVGGGILGALAGGFPAFAGAAAGGPALKTATQKGLAALGVVPDSRVEGQTLSDAALETGINAVGGAAIGAVGSLAKKALAPGYKSALEFLKSKGYTPTLGDVGSSSGRAIARYADDATQTAQKGNLDLLQSRILGASGGELSNASSFGSNFVGSISSQLSGLKNQSSALYNELEKATPSKVPLTGLKQKILSAITPISENGVIPKSIDADLGSASAAIRELLDSPEVSVPMLRSLRRTIGNASKTSPFGNVLGQINKDITDELGVFYGSISPQLGQKYAQAEQLYAQFNTQKNVLRQTLGKQTADSIIKGEPDAISSEAIANQLSNLAANSTGGQRLSGLMGILPQEQKGALGEYILNQAAQKSTMNAPVGEVFDPAKFSKTISPYAGAKETGLLGDATQASMQGLQQEAAMLAPGAQALRSNVDAGMARMNANPFMYGAGGGAGLGALMGFDPVMGAGVGLAAPFALRKVSEQLAKRPGLLSGLAEFTPTRSAGVINSLQESATGVSGQPGMNPTNNPAVAQNATTVPTPTDGATAPKQGGGLPDLETFLNGPQAASTGAKKGPPSIDEFIKGSTNAAPAEAGPQPLTPAEVDQLLAKDSGLTPLSNEEIDGLLAPAEPVSIIPAKYKAAHAVLSKLESSGNYKAINPSTKALGRYQFMAPTLEDIGFLNKGASKGRTTAATLADPSAWKIEGGRDAFINNPEIQDLAMRQLMESNEKTLTRMGLINEKSDPRVINGLLTLSHLYGPGGAKRFWNEGDFSYGLGNPMASVYFKKGFLGGEEV